jgi:hypothetical protein
VLGARFGFSHSVGFLAFARSTSISLTSLDCVGAILSMNELGRGVSPSRAAFGLGGLAARQEARYSIRPDSLNVMVALRLES